MATQTQYDLLKQTAADALAAWNQAKQLLPPLQNDATYVYNSTRLAQVRDRVAQGKGYGWIDASGTFWSGSDADAAFNTAATYNATQDKKIADAQAAIDQAKKNYDTASAALTQYEATSPVAAATIAAATAADNMKTALIVAAIVLLVGLAIGIVWWKNKKKKTTAA